MMEKVGTPQAEVTDVRKTHRIGKMRNFGEMVIKSPVGFIG